MNTRNIIGLILGAIGFVGIGALLTFGFEYKNIAFNILKSILTGDLIRPANENDFIEVTSPTGELIKIDPKIAFNIYWVGPLKSEDKQKDGLQNKEKIIQILNEILKDTDKNSLEVFKSENPSLLMRTYNQEDLDKAILKVIELTDLGAIINYSDFSYNFYYGIDVINIYESLVKENKIYVGK